MPALRLPDEFVVHGLVLHKEQLVRVMDGLRARTHLETLQKRIGFPRFLTEVLQQFLLVRVGGVFTCLF